MRASEPRSGEAAHRAQGATRLLDALLQTPAGVLIHDQLAQLLGEWQGVRSSFPAFRQTVTQNYTLLLALLLGDFARNTGNDHVVRVCARLIQARRAYRAQLATDALAADDATAMEAVLREEVARLAQVLRDTAAPASPERPVAAPGAPTPSPPRAAAARAEPVAVPAGAEATQPQVDFDRRQRLERKRDAIEQQEKALLQKAGEAIEQNRKFGDLLQIVSSALQQAEGAEEVANLRRILIGGVDKLRQGQRALAETLESTGEDLRVVAAGNKNLRDVLRKARQLSLTDEGTGLPNRRAFIRRLDEEIGRALRYDTWLALAILDLDGFKTVNDTRGHLAGDAVLRCYAERILSIFRHYDMAARYGGEEFAVLLPNTDKEGALCALRKMQNGVANAECAYQGTSLRLPTFSAGLTLYVPGESRNSLMERADKALYRAKQLGRNRIEVEVPPVLAARGTEDTNSL
jgi:diguanylate cyclase (GGDEF)-like protein